MAATDVDHRLGELQRGLFGKRYLSAGRILNILSVVLGLAAWEVVGRQLPATLLVPPSNVLDSWLSLVLDGTLPAALQLSLQHMLLGYVLAIVTAIPLAFALSRSQIVRWAVNPYIDALYATPSIAYLPLVIVWFGLFFKARVFMVFVHCFFEMLIDTQQGLDSISEEYMDVGRSFDLGWFDFQRKVFLPASLPYVFTGLRIGVGRAVRGMIVAEIFLAVVNLGEILEAAGNSFDMGIQLAVIVTISLVGVVFQSAVQYVERLAIPWRHMDRGE